jgi:hypothetical protein
MLPKLQQEKDQRRIAAQNEVSATYVLVEQRNIEKEAAASKFRHKQYLRYKELLDTGMDTDDILALFPEHSIFVRKVSRNQTTNSPGKIKTPRMIDITTPQISNKKQARRKTTPISPAFSTRSRANLEQNK